MTIRFERKQAVAVLTIDRPEVRNALDFKTSDELLEAWRSFRDDDASGLPIKAPEGNHAAIGFLVFIESSILAA